MTMQNDLVMDIITNHWEEKILIKIQTHLWCVFTMMSKGEDILNLDPGLDRNRMMSNRPVTFPFLHSNIRLDHHSDFQLFCILWNT